MAIAVDGLPDLMSAARFRRACVAALVCWFALIIAYIATVDRCFYGCPAGPFLMSEVFGVPPSTAAAGVLPVYRWEAGWDGQFHYHQSNDPFMRGDAREHIDNPSYRYQRNLIPFLAYATSRMVGCDVTPPLWYQLVQLTFVAIGFGALAWLLGENGIPSPLALLWVCTGGLLWSLFRGLPDGPSDALFILSLCGLHRRSLPFYTSSATLLVLTREGYAIYAAAVFLLTLLGRIEWHGKVPRTVAAGITAAPGIAVLGWAWFVAHQLSLPFLYGSSIARHVLVDWPFVAAARALARAAMSGDVKEFFYLGCATGLIGSVLWCAIRLHRESLLAAVAIPYVVLIAATGSVVWADPSGYFKATSALVVVALLLTRHQGTVVLRIAIALMVVAGIPLTVNRLIQQMPQLAPVAIDPVEIAQPLLHRPRAERAAVVATPREDVTLQALSTSTLHRPLPTLLSRRLALLNASVTNAGPETWTAAVPGEDCIRLGYQLRDATGVVCFEGRRDLRADVPPGTSAEFLVAVPMPRRSGHYELRVGMLQEGRHWFCDASGAQVARTTLSVP
jgi:hypothetical protein